MNMKEENEPKIWKYLPNWRIYLPLLVEL